MITVFSFHPEHFNNNGDQGNLEVLTQELNSRGSGVAQTIDISAADFVLIGDASFAAIEHYSSELETLRPLVSERFQSGRPTLIVGSSYEFFAHSLGLSAHQVQRKSEFAEASGYFGYRNTDSDLPIVTRNGLFVATSLFGPLLAKNPQLLAEFLVEFGVEAELSDKRLAWIEEIRRRSIGG